MKAKVKPKSFEAFYQHDLDRCATCNHSRVAHLSEHTMCAGLIQTRDGIFVCKCRAFEQRAAQEVAQ